MRIPLHVLKPHEPSRPSLALEGADFFQYPEHQQAALFFGKGHLIGFHDVPWADFAAELQRRFQLDSATRPNLTATNEQIPDGAPIAFLCHENRDKPLIESLATKLQAFGIKVWLDKQNLRGDDRRPELIPKVLEKQCDYVIVLQSPRMLDRPESYCFLEIDLAAKRPPKFFPGLRYLIPTIFEGNARLPLDPLQSFQCVADPRPVRGNLHTPE